jgi:phage I-like protein
MSYVNRPPRGQQRDKPYREALRMELAAAGEDMKKLREIARTHIEKAAAGDMQAIKELADRLDGRPAQILEHNNADSEQHNNADSEPITKIVREIVHTWPSPEELHSEDGITFERSNGNGSGEPDS